MVDDLTIKQPQDPTKINIHEKWEVAYWTKKWSVTEKQLKDAVAAVGVSTAKVAAHLGKKV
ncbi:hypothetical protein ABID82_006561 [Methylobacterium sp. PvP062]|uniref:DUF3606 domain-containing protein n=1 Tax=Methylobacterium radiotolerans TaxID=31998 RepID=A0ABV2NTA3_9HYPH|nr:MULTISPECIES: DUF3606 domain-containing protein [unclassified Methylobacterium]MBP2498990.1 hypothetical protein [Methylobacterium sp. PvP105]MBP2505510.1 hypothetical protein [Methylobacterium sp. PvP109]